MVPVVLTFCSGENTTSVASRTFRLTFTGIAALRRLMRNVLTQRHLEHRLDDTHARVASQARAIAFDQF